MSDAYKEIALFAAVEELRAAVQDPGSHPEHHFTLMDRHRAEWPTLWYAIDAILASSPSTTPDDANK